MGAASFVQTSFLGGEWSPAAQGRMDSDHYKSALNLCTNYYTVEVGSLIRRMGTRFLGTTKGGVAGRVMGFEFSITNPYQMEFTAGFLRFWREAGIVTLSQAAISTISTATPAKVTTQAAHGFSTGDTVIFTFTGDGYATVASRLRNWQFIITVTSSTEFTIKDAVTGANIVGANLGGDLTSGGIVEKVFEIATQYTTDKWKKLRKVQDESTVILLHPTIKPYVVTVGSPFTLAAAAFTDGPYLDPNTTATTLTPSGLSGSITVTASSTTGINGGSGFVSTDVGRMIRIFSEPDTWLAASDYVQGDAVTWEGSYYAAIRSVRHGPSSPAENVSSWSPVNDVAFWSWGTITAVADTTHVTVTISGHAIRNTNATTTWRLGLYCDTLGWPTCGCYHENRLWLAGVIKNRFDGSKVGAYLNFSPTADDGTVADDNACSEIAKAVDANDILWMLSEDDGIWFGTVAGEWRVRASTLDDPITPTSIQVRRMTTFGSFDAEAICAPSTILYIQKKQRKILEIMTEPNETGHYSPNLSLTADHLTLAGVEELAMMQEPTHLLFCRKANGKLLSCAYMRAPDKFFAAWATIELGCDRLVESISVGPSDDGLTERLFMVTNDEFGVRHVNCTEEVFNAETAVWDGRFVDDAITPSGAKILLIANGDAIDGVRFYGLYPLIGMTVAIVIGGVDLGDFAITTDTLDIPFTADFTQASLAALSETDEFDGLSTTVIVEA